MLLKKIMKNMKNIKHYHTLYLCYLIYLQSTIFNTLDSEQFPNYDQYVTKHVDLVMLQKNIDDQKYHSTDAFQADVSWILHNAMIYPSKCNVI